MSRLYNDEPRLGAAHLITITIMLKMMLATVVMMTMNYDQEWSDQRHAGDADSAGVRRHNHHDHHATLRLYYHNFHSFIVLFKSHHI